MRRAMRDTAGILAILLLGTFSLAAPAYADSRPIWEDTFAEADGAPVAALADIAEAEPHSGGFNQPTSRINARPGSLGASAYDTLPDRVDLSSYLPAVGDQGAIGQCVAWTLTRNLMGYFAGRYGGADSPYAPLYLYMRNVAAGGAPNSGLNPDAVLGNLQAYGVDSQDDYFQGVSNYKTAPTSAQIANAQNYKISGWSRLFSGANQGINAKTIIQQALAHDTPVAVGFPVFRDFMNLGAHTLYDTTSGTNLGGHMVTAYGYDASGLYLRNQWGTGWGNGGSAKVSWDFVTTVMTAAYTVTGIMAPSSPVAVSPQVTQLSTTRGSAGTSVTIVGSGLARATGVTFGGTRAPFSQSVSNGVTRLVATAPARSGGTVQIAVTNPSGTSPDTAADDFTYPSPAPGISALNPSAGTVKGGTTVTLTGTDLGPATSVRIGSNTVTPSNVTDNSLTFVTPASGAGAYSVTVTSSTGTSAASRFTYVAANAPTITGLSPASGRANTTTQIVVSGTNLEDVSSVSVAGGTTSFAELSSTQLRVNMPARSAGNAEIRVTTPGGSATATFTYVAPAVPAISSITPTSGATTATTIVTVYGSNLTNVTRVTLGSTALSWTMVDATTMKVFVKGMAAGSARLTVTTSAGTSNGVTFTSVAPSRPAISSLSPSVGLTTASTTVTVTGSGFTGATRVSLGGRATKFTLLSSTRLTFIAPTGRAGNFPVVIVGPGGTSAGKTFTYKSTLVPQIFSLSPSAGSTTSNTATVITGRYLTGASMVVTSENKRVSFKRISDEQINLTLVRRKAGTITIRVRTSGGYSNAVSFRYVTPTAPTITGLSTRTAAAGKSAAVTVSGSGLIGVRRVTVGGAAASFKMRTASQLLITAPVRGSGAFYVVVTTAVGSSRPSTASVLTYR